MQYHLEMIWNLKNVQDSYRSTTYKKIERENDKRDRIESECECELGREWMEPITDPEKESDW